MCAQNIRYGTRMHTYEVSQLERLYRPPQICSDLHLLRSLKTSPGIHRAMPWRRLLYAPSRPGPAKSRIAII